MEEEEEEQAQGQRWLPVVAAVCSQRGRRVFDINSTLILYLCSTVQSASIRTVARFF